MLSATRAELAYSMAGPCGDQRGIRFKIHPFPDSRHLAVQADISALARLYEGPEPAASERCNQHVMLRLPVSHVLSLFMHCNTISRRVRRAAAQPSSIVKPWPDGKGRALRFDGSFRYLDAGTLPTERRSATSICRRAPVPDPRNWATHRLQQQARTMPRLRGGGGPRIIATGGPDRIRPQKAFCHRPTQATAALYVRLRVAQRHHDVDSTSATRTALHRAA